MGRIRGRHTGPEMQARAVLRQLGLSGYRLHRKDLPGRPDIAFLGERRAIFVNGCFWHQHADCREGRPPKSNAGYWLPKLERNKARDKANLMQLAALGWEILTLWECETKDKETLVEKLKGFLGPSRTNHN